MTYFKSRLSADDPWLGASSNVKLPNDAALKDRDKLAELSGPVVTYNLYEKGEKNADS